MSKKNQKPQKKTKTNHKKKQTKKPQNQNKDLCERLVLKELMVRDTAQALDTEPGMVPSYAASVRTPQK